MAAQVSAGGWSDVLRKPPPPKQQEGISSGVVESLKSSEGISIAVVDANAIIQGGEKLNDGKKRIVSVEEVLQEIRDPASRHRLASLPFPIEVMEPSPEAIKKVVNFARETGDLQILSDVDIKLMALTYTLEAQIHGTNNLRERPPPLHLVRVKRLPENMMPGWGSNVPNLEEWEALEHAVEAAPNPDSRILPLKDLSLNITPENGDMCNKVDLMVDSGEIETSSQEMGGFPSRRANRFPHVKREINIEDKKMVADGIDASKGEVDGNPADWRPAVSRSTHRRYLKRQARRALSSASVQSEHPEAEESVESTQLDGTSLEDESSNVNQEKDHYLNKEMHYEILASETGDLHSSQLMENMNESCMPSDDVQHSDALVSEPGLCVEDDILDEIGHLKLEGDETEIELNKFNHLEISSLSDQNIDGSEVDDNNSEQSWTLRSLSESSVACVTSDFAMQNVILQMGLRLLTPSGMQIRQLHRWVLKCHACNRVTAEIGRMFCPKCGNGGTLRRVSVTVDGNGIVQTASRPRISVRGTRFSLPLPQGGRDAITKNPILREDQLPHKLLYPKSKKKGNQGLDIPSADEITFHSSERRAPLKPPVRKALAVFSGKRNPNDNHFSRNKH
ncbi:RNA-binding NOB1-like protein isoform X1 [Nymphaea colorata]|nr:RNA-binding NOB1-like protein isoform X1 [Nymphaea colorata]